jgi:hypothetical protein
MLQNSSPVSPVLTEHTPGLRCLGGLIEASGRGRVFVLVHDIEDTTVPRFNEDRRLSLGGSYVLQTALSRLETDQVVGVMNEGAARGPLLALSGAWTQDDQFVSQGGVGVGVSVGDGSARLGGRTSYDFIAGDFISSQNGQVRLSTAVGVALSRRGNEALLVVDDGEDRAEIGLDRRLVQGAQMAQRRILEAVTLVHLADYFGIDYRPCLEIAAQTPDAFISAITMYERSGERERNRMVQQELQRLGHLTETPDGLWGPVSRRALSDYQALERLPITGAHNAVVFALMASQP